MHMPHADAVVVCSLLFAKNAMHSLNNSRPLHRILGGPGPPWNLLAGTAPLAPLVPNPLIMTRNHEIAYEWILAVSRIGGIYETFVHVQVDIIRARDWILVYFEGIARRSRRLYGVSYIRGSREIWPMPSLLRTSVKKSSVKKVW